MPSDFTRNLLKWNAASNRRQMPWKGETDPYRIWLSEIILQQTRVEQGQAYYEKFIKAYPTIEKLASAPENEVFKMWEGLGYYSRCRNLIETARVISTIFGGRFPSSYSDIIKLKGIGPYTAAAISSFAFNECRAVIDGNVQRVLARYFAISTPANTVQGKKLFNELAASLIDKRLPAVYNQAIMDFGATVCKPKNPLCSHCVLSSECQAFHLGVVNTLPVKEKTIKKRSRWFYYFVIETDDHIYVRKRETKDIWQNLYEFVLLERDEPADNPAGDFLNGLLRQPYHIRHTSKVYSQQLTHQHIHGRFFVVQVAQGTKLEGSYELVKKAQLSRYAFPKLINSFLQSDPENR